MLPPYLTPQAQRTKSRAQQIALIFFVAQQLRAACWQPSSCTPFAGVLVLPVACKSSIEITCGKV
jgi:hypothetical protein